MAVFLCWLPTQEAAAAPPEDPVTIVAGTFSPAFAYRHHSSIVRVSMPNTARLVKRLRPTQPLLHTSWETLTHARLDGR